MDKKEQTKKFIIEQTAPLFNKKGYAGTSLADLTGVTKLSKGSIYGNFGNKDEVAINCFLFNVDKIISQIKNNLKGVENSIEKLMVFPNVFSKIYHEVIENGGCPVINTLIEADDTHPVLYKQALDIIQAYEGSLVSIIEEGKTRGEIIKTAESQKTAQIIITLLEGGITLAKVINNDSYVKNAIIQVKEIIDAIRS